MNRNLLLVLGGFAALMLVGAGALLFVQRQQAGAPPAPEHRKLQSVGVVVRGKSYLPGVEGFRSKMAELGYEEGVNVVYDIRIVEQTADLPGVVRELIAKGVDVLHTYSTPATVAAYAETKQIPIVFGSMGDPLASQTIRSLQKPDTNVTGVNSLSAPLVSKRLEFLLEAAPRVKKVAFPLTREDIPGQSSYAFILETAEKLGVEVVPYWISEERTSEEVAAAILRKDVDGIVLSSDTAMWRNLQDYVAQAKKEKLPFAVFDKDMVAAGGLVGYGPDYFVSGEQSAVLVDKILQGQQPGNLPIENPRRLVLALNLDTARAIGLEFPVSLLQKADVVYPE